MQIINIEQTNETPGVILDKDKATFSFFGRSLPEDVNGFYAQIQDWFLQYCLEPLKETEISFSLDYFNSSSARKIVKMLIETEKIHNVTSKIHVSWFYKKGDEIMQERGMELQSVLNIPFDLIEEEKKEEEEN